jgi:hypothetical protein
MENFPLAICDFQTRIKATEVSILATSAGHLKYWRYGKTREFRVKLNFAPKIPNFLPGTLAFYRIITISNDQQMSLISTLL